MTRTYQPIKILERKSPEDGYRKIEKKTGKKISRPKETNISRNELEPYALDLIARIREADPDIRSSLAGSFRRHVENCHDLDILIAPYSERAETCIKQLGEVIISGQEKVSILYSLQNGKTIQVDFRFIPLESWGPALQYFTGSKEHNISVRRIAKQKGFLLNERGLYDGDGKRIDDNTEGGIYKPLNLRWLPPQYRNGYIHHSKNQPVPAPSWCIDHQEKDFCKRERNLKKVNH